MIPTNTVGTTADGGQDGAYGCGAATVDGVTYCTGRGLWLFGRFTLTSCKALGARHSSSGTRIANPPLGDPPRIASLASANVLYTHHRLTPVAPSGAPVGSLARAPPARGRPRSLTDELLIIVSSTISLRTGAKALSKQAEVASHMCCFAVGAAAMIAHMVICKADGREDFRF